MATIKNKYRLFEVGALSISAISSVFFMLYASEGELLFYILCLWAILPYLSFFIISLIVNFYFSSPRLSLATFITSILMLSFTLVVYIDGMFIHASSTSALLFLFVPLYLLVGEFLMLVFY